MFKHKQSIFYITILIFYQTLFGIIVSYFLNPILLFYSVVIGGLFGISLYQITYVVTSRFRCSDKYSFLQNNAQYMWLFCLAMISLVKNIDCTYSVDKSSVSLSQLYVFDILVDPINIIPVLYLLIIISFIFISLIIINSKTEVKSLQQSAINLCHVNYIVIFYSINEKKYNNTSDWKEILYYAVTSYLVYLVSFYIISFLKSRLCQTKQNAQVTYTQRDIQTAAYHETGHALIYLSMKKIPEDFSCLVNFVRDGQTFLGETSRFRSSDAVLSHKELWNDMLMLMGGPVCEEYFMGEKTIGNTSDLSSWQHLARTYLISSQDNIFYANPTTDLEQKSNNEAVKKLYNIQVDYLKKIIIDNEIVAKKLAKNLIEVGKIDLSMMNEMKDKFKTPK